MATSLTLLFMHSPVIANAVKQSMTPDCMDCRAPLAVTKALFKVRVRYLAGYGGLAMTIRCHCEPFDWLRTG
jgi:hypothetical protein